MNNDNIDIERLRAAWQEMGKILNSYPSAGNNIDNLNRKTALEKLRDRYRVFWVVSVIMVVSSCLIFMSLPTIERPLNYYLAAAFAIYFLTVFCMDHWIWVGLGTIDPLKMSVSAVASKSMFYRKRHLQFMAIIIPMAVALLGFTGYVFSSEPYFISGMVTGAIIGAIIGIIQFRRFMAEYRKLS